MRHKNIFFGIVVLFAVASCQNKDIKLTSIGSVVIVNAVSNGQSVMLGSNAASVPNNSGVYFSLEAGSPDIYIWPKGDSLHPYYYSNKSINLGQGDVYSLYLSGSLPNPDAILVKDNIPFRNDSTAGIRFANLSPNSPPLNITLTRTPTVNEVANLNYKQISEFKNYLATYSSPLDTFQIRNASTNAILLTIPFNTTTNIRPRFTNITLVIRGMVNGSPVLGYTRVNNDR